MINQKVAIKTVARLRVLRLPLGLAVSLIIMSTSIANFTYSQPFPSGGVVINPGIINPNLLETTNIDRNDPSQASIPQLDFNDTAKSIAVRLKFVSQGEVSVESIRVSQERAHTNVGNPPLLRVRLLNNTGNLINEFNAWNPLWAFEWEYTGGEFPTAHEKRIFLQNATASIIFPFDKRLASMEVSDIALNKEIVSVNLAPTIRQFCEENPGDPDCTENLAKGKSLTVNVNGTVSQVEGPGTFGGVIHVGDNITGSYTYIPSTADSSPNDTRIGVYPHLSPPFGIKMNINGITFQTAPVDIQGGITVINGEPGTPNNIDEIIVSSLNNVPVNATDITEISLSFINHTGTAISSDSLPINAPEVSSIWNPSVLRINGQSAHIIANITSAGTE